MGNIQAQFEASFQHLEQEQTCFKTMSSNRHAQRISNVQAKDSSGN